MKSSNHRHGRQNGRGPLALLLTLALVAFAAPLMAQVNQDHDLWFVCNATNHPLPTTATLTVQNPNNARMFTWVVTAGRDKVAFSNNSDRITTNVNTVEIRSLAASAAMNDVTINVNFAVANNVNHMLTVRTPRSLRPGDITDEGRGMTCAAGGNRGYLSRISYEILDQFAANTGNAGINEQLGAKINDQQNNWPVGREGGANTNGGRFVDRVCVTNGGRPNPTPPQDPLSNNRVDRIPQTWFAGDNTDPANHTGCRVQTDDIQRFIDHGRHINIVSPPGRNGMVEGEVAQVAGHPSLPPVHKPAKLPQQPRTVAYPTPVQDVMALQRDAAVVIKGTITEVHEDSSLASRTPGGALPGSKTMVALVEVTRVLKGDATESELARVAFAENPDRLPISLAPGETALLFLRASQQGVYTLVDPFVGTMPVTSRHVAAPPNATTTGLLEAEILASVDDSDRDVARVALEQVGNLGSVGSTQALQGIANAGDLEFRALAYAALVRLHDHSAWDAAIAFAATPSADERVQRLQLLVAEAVMSTRDKNMVPRLGELLSSGSLPLRRAAASALRNIGDLSSLPYLALGLNDDDVDVRYSAMMAIAQMEGSPSAWTPARGPFEQDQTTYLQHWQNWWRSRTL